MIKRAITKENHVDNEGGGGLDVQKTSSVMVHTAHIHHGVQKAAYGAQLKSENEWVKRMDNTFSGGKFLKKECV